MEIIFSYVHGGEFAYGSPLQFSQETIIDNYNNGSRNVVFVTAAFRQAIFGYIRGKKILTTKNVEGYAFLSIPIAETPTGNLRFKAPISRKPWEGIINTTDYTVACYWNSSKTSYYSSDFKMDEDCLQVNVFTNKNCLKNGNCSVTFYVHGGEFAYGSPLQFSQETIIDNYNNGSRNVVFVTAAFRQAMFGVMNLNWKLNLSMDMNAGLHDIVHAMKWVKSEIATFGGDPNRLTIMGHSGGGSLVKLLAMSPKSKSMVNQVIAMSAAADLVLVRDKNQRVSRKNAKEIGCANFDIYDKQWDDLQQVENVLTCLRNKTAKEISEIQPIVEPDFMFISVARDSGPNAIIPDSFEEMESKMNPIPILSGTVSKEFLDAKSTVNDGVFVDQTELYYWCQRALQLVGYYDASDKVILDCMKEYNRTSKSMYTLDDPEIYVPTRVFAEDQTKRGGHVFLYEYSYPDIGGAYIRGPNSPPYTPDESPHHAQELAYIVGQHAGYFTPKDDQIQYLLTGILVDFMNNGTPVVVNRTWPAFEPNLGNYYEIDFPDPTLESPGIKNGYHQQAYNFWHKFIPTVAGNKTIPQSEEELLFQDKVETITEIPHSHSGQRKNDGLGLNWAIAFWIGAFIIVLLAISHAITCCKLKTKKSEYQSL
uniref:Carboxylic ester hydrolase n=1 Tax=Panagrolaimus sp. JU765 TaxID=591449 RepID=A0AC34QCA3_9BILA